MTTEDLKKLRLYAELTNTIDKYVYLREDEKGKYIEYAFKEGAPHDNRCLSWYDSYQEEAYIRNGWIKDINDLDIIKRNRDKRVNEIFVLSSFTCGYEGNMEKCLEENKKNWEQYHHGEPFIREDHICRVGKPAPYCVKNGICRNWTYEEPVKCACWHLHEATVPEYVTIPIALAMKLESEIKKETISNIEI